MNLSAIVTPGQPYYFMEGFFTPQRVENYEMEKIEEIGFPISSISPTSPTFPIAFLK
jgi:hypothetical protein